MVRLIGAAYLTLFPLAPPAIVETAAAAGLDFVGLRLKPVTAGEPDHQIRVGSRILRETLLRMDHTGLVVRDIEFLALTPCVTSADWLPMLETGAALGASALTVAGSDPDISRLLDTLRHLTEDAADFGIRPLLEPISYQPISRLIEAATVARAANAGLMVDPLHLQRGGSTIDELRALEPSLVPVLQICDALLEDPVGPDRVEKLQYEARVQRLLPGDGELPLVDLLEAAPPLVPVSIEVPHARLRAKLSPLEFAVCAASSVRALVARVDE